MTNLITKELNREDKLRLKRLIIRESKGMIIWELITGKLYRLIIGEIKRLTVELKKMIPGELK